MNKRFLNKIKIIAILSVMTLSLQACSDKEDSVILEYKTDIQKLNQSVSKMSGKIDELNEKVDQLSGNIEKQKEDLESYNKIIVGKIDENKKEVLDIDPEVEGFYDGKYFPAGNEEGIEELEEKDIEVYEIKPGENEEEKIIMTNSGGPMAYELWKSTDENPLIAEGVSLTDPKGNEIEYKDFKNKKGVFKDEDGSKLTYKHTLVEGIEEDEIYFADVFVKDEDDTDVKYMYEAPENFYNK